MHNLKEKGGILIKAYYAHSMYKYDTEIEKYEIDLIKSYFPTIEILDPNKDIGTDFNSDKEAMKECIKNLRNCDILIFSSINGCVGKGVQEEIEFAKKHNIPIYYILYNSISEVDPESISFSIFNYSDRLYSIFNGTCLFNVTLQEDQEYYA